MVMFLSLKLIFDLNQESLQKKNVISKLERWLGLEEVIFNDKLSKYYYYLINSGLGILKTLQLHIQ